MPQKNNSIIYIFLSLLLVVAAIITTAVINRTRSPGASSQDIRARADASSPLQFTGTVSSVDENKGVLVVDNLQFASGSSGSTLGLWTVTPPAGFSLASIGTGTKVTIFADGATFLIKSHTLTATQISINR